MNPIEALRNQAKEKFECVCRRSPTTNAEYIVLTTQTGVEETVLATASCNRTLSQVVLCLFRVASSKLDKLSMFEYFSTSVFTYLKGTNVSLYSCIDSTDGNIKESVKHVIKYLVESILNPFYLSDEESYEVGLSIQYEHSIGDNNGTTFSVKYIIKSDYPGECFVITAKTGNAVDTYRADVYDDVTVDVTVGEMINQLMVILKKCTCCTQQAITNAEQYFQFYRDSPKIKNSMFKNGGITEYCKEIIDGFIIDLNYIDSDY